MASSEADISLANGGEESAAQRLMKAHESHQAKVEDVPDEDFIAPPKATTTETSPPSWAPVVSSKAAGKQKESLPPKSGPDTRSEELFPSLGGSAATKQAAPIKGPWAGGKPSANGRTNGGTPTNGASGASTPVSDTPTPALGHTAASQRGAAPPAMIIPGRNLEEIIMEKDWLMPKGQLKRPLPDIIKDINRKSRANINVVSLSGGRTKFQATGPPDVAQQALRDLVQQIGAKVVIQVPIPQSVRAHIIGKQGSTIKALQEKTGAKIQLPKVGDSQPSLDEDDDSEINVTVEGNALTAEAARVAIQKIVGERSANVNTKVRGIPAEFYPFIAGPGKTFLNALEEAHGVQITIPPHQALSSEAPQAPAAGERPIFSPAGNDNPIQMAGDRVSVQAARAEIERRAAELQDLLQLDQLSIERGKHEFIIGDRGIPMDEFFANTGCVILLPTDKDDDMVTVIGPADQISNGVEKAIDLTSSIQSSNFDIARVFRNAPNGAADHARNVTRYLRNRREIERLEREYKTRINTRFSQGGAMPWELFFRDGKKAIQARTEITAIVNGHPPSRMATVPVDPFFHRHMRMDVAPRVRESHGVHVVVPDPSEQDAAVLLVFEGPSTDEEYRIPRSQPTADEVRAFTQGLKDARSYIIDLISKQEQIESATLDVPLKFHEKLKKFIKAENSSPADRFPIRVTSTGTIVTLRGPVSAVQSLAAKATAFIAQVEEEEKERGFTMSFEFPQKFANHLIGKQGSKISQLREKFDVEINVQDGKVELTGPKAKAEAAKAHITTMARNLADETTVVLKIDPKYHRELIGAQGSLINRLQTKYKVAIFFPRSAKNAKDDNSNGDAASEAGKPRRQQEPDEVSIRGPKKGVEEARGEMLDLLQYLKDTSFTATVEVQQKQVPSIIGQGGAALEELRQATGARVDIPTSRDSEKVEIVIKGTKDQVAAAKKLLEQKRAVFNDTVVKTIEVDRKYHRDLIGASGSKLKDIVLKAGGSDDRRELARTVQFPKQDSDGNTIKVEGRTDVVDKIVAQIQKIVEERESQVTRTVEVPIEKHRTLIGRGGDIKKTLESRFGVSIEVPRQGDGKTGVTITGRPEAVEKAKEHILSLTKEQPGETLQVPRSMHHAVSNGGLFFRKMRSDHNVTIDHAGEATPPKPSIQSTRANGGPLPLITDDAETAADAHSWKVVENSSEEDGDISWVLRGSPENIAKVKKAIQSALDQAQKNTATGYLVLPDPTTYRYVIGKGGSKIDAIRKQSGCRINVPRDQAKDEAIEVIGSKDGVEKAKVLILEAVQEGLAPRPPRERD